MDEFSKKRKMFEKKLNKSHLVQMFETPALERYANMTEWEREIEVVVFEPKNVRIKRRENELEEDKLAVITWAQFHQRSTYSFYPRRSNKA
jgi:hypothetical protein